MLNMPLLTPKRVAILTSVFLLLILYGSAYLYARSQHLLIHRTGYHHGHYLANHRITGGDFGTGFNSTMRLASACEILFTPLRWVETVLWYVAQPPRSP